MRFVRSLLSHWKPITVWTLCPLLLKGINYAFQQWIGNKVADAVDKALTLVNLRQITETWLWIAAHPLPSMIASTCLLVVYFSIETEIHDRKKRRLNSGYQRGSHESKLSTAGPTSNPVDKLKGFADSLGHNMLFPPQPFQDVAVPDIVIINAPEPARVELAIMRKGTAWLWQIRNKELKEIGPCRLRIVHQRSFDSALDQYREPYEFSCDLGNDPRIAAGEIGAQHIFARLEADQLEIGSTRLTRLPWPRGDANAVHHWLLELEFSGLTSLPRYALWKITLVIKWYTETKILHFVQFSSGLSSANKKI